MIRCAAVFVILLVVIGYGQSNPVNTNINTNTNNNYNSNLATIYLFQAVLKLTEIISGLQSSGVLRAHKIPDFPIPIDHIKALVRGGLKDMEKPDPVKDALYSTDTYDESGTEDSATDEDEATAFYRLVGDQFGGMSVESDEFRQTLEAAIKAFKGQPVPPLHREKEW